MIGTGEVDISQGRGFTRGAVGVVVVALAVSLTETAVRPLNGRVTELAMFPAVCCCSFGHGCDYQGETVL